MKGRKERRGEDRRGEEGKQPGEREGLSTRNVYLAPASK